MFTDLHMHTVYSDGEYEPLELVRKAREAGVGMMAIADHNNIGGSKIAVSQNPYDDIIVVPSVEFTAKSPSHINIHILGHNIDLSNPMLNELTKAYTEDSRRRILSLVELLKTQYNLTFKDEDIEKMLSSIGNIGRPEVAKLCKEYGYTKNVEEAFGRYLNPVKSKIVKKMVDPTDAELISYIQAAGGVPCLAHPKSIKKTIPELREYIKELMGYGLMAIEAYHSDCPKDTTFELLKIAKEFGLYVSVGSDYHGPTVSPNVQIASGKAGNLNIERVSIMNLFTEVKGYDRES